MNNSIESLRHQIASAGELQSVVRTMKALAASSIGQYERSVAALADYRRTVELGLGACLREPTLDTTTPSRPDGAIDAIVFGSDQGLVGQFNDLISDHALATLAPLGGAPRVWAVGDRVRSRLIDAGQPVVDTFPVPVSVEGIAPLVGRIAVASAGEGATSLHLFYHRPGAAGYSAAAVQVLPLDAAWKGAMAAVPWPTSMPPQVMGTGVTTLRGLIREYLFVSIYRACAESLASENASRLAAMQRADKNIEDLLEELNQGFHRLRQSSIDEELLDLVSSFEVLS